MNIKDYINEQQIVCFDTIDNKEQAFQYIAEIAQKNGMTAKVETIIKKLSAREAMTSTGLKDGFAIPHAQDEQINKSMIIIITSKTTIEWETLDDQDVRVIFALLIPLKFKSTIHLECLATISAFLMDDDFRAQIKKATTPQMIYDVVLTFWDNLKQ